MNQLKTYNQWKQAGYYVRKGQKCCGYNNEGDAIFHKSQVSINTSSTYNHNNELGHELDELMGFDAYSSPGLPF